MINKLLVLPVSVILIAILYTVPVECAGPVSVIINGERVASDVAPVIAEGRTMVPMRAVFEALGAAVSYDIQSKTVTVTAGALEIILSAGSKSVMIKTGGKAEERFLDVEPMETGGRILLPVRFISEALNAEVRWDSVKRQVWIYSPNKAWAGGIEPWNDLEAYQAVYVVNEYLALLQGAVWGGALYDYHPILFSRRVREAPEPWAVVWQPSMPGMAGTSACRLNFSVMGGNITGTDEAGRNIYEIIARIWSYDPRAGEPAFTDWTKAYRVICEEYETDSGSTAAHWVIDGERTIGEIKSHSSEMPDFWSIK